MSADPQPPQFDPVARRTVAADVRDALVAAVRSGSLPPGSQLPSERELCERFGVARSSLREALHGLMSLGLIEHRGNRTHVVETLPEIPPPGDGDKRRVSELFAVREIVELPIVQLAARHASDAQRAEISRLASQFSADMALVDFRIQDRSFHSAVAHGCGNATLAEIYFKVLDLLFRSDEFDDLLEATPNQDVVREIITSATEAHQQIARGIGYGDPGLAVGAAERHLRDVHSRMIAAMV